MGAAAVENRSASDLKRRIDPFAASRRPQTVPPDILSGYKTPTALHIELKALLLEMHELGDRSGGMQQRRSSLDVSDIAGASAKIPTERKTSHPFNTSADIHASWPQARGEWPSMGPAATKASAPRASGTCSCQQRCGASENDGAPPLHTWSQQPPIRTPIMCRPQHEALDRPAQPDV